jgi:hypothetical protein
MVEFQGRSRPFVVAERVCRKVSGDEQGGENCAHDALEASAISREAAAEEGEQ